MTSGGVPRAVIVICDSLRADLIQPAVAPFLSELRARAASFAAHRSVFPSTTRASAASIATGCRPARHGLLGNTMALDEGEGLVCRSAGAPDFRDRMRRATGRTLQVPTLAERLRWHGETSVSCANVSPGAAYFQDPDGYGWVHHSAGSFGPGRVPIEDPASAGLTKGIAGDRAMTERFCTDVLEDRAPSVAILWLSEPDYTGHHSALGCPEHKAAIAGADGLVKQVYETVRRLDPTGEDILFVTGSDHGMETVAEAIDLTELLVAAGLKESRDSRELVVAPNGTAATLYFAEPDGSLVQRVAQFLSGENWVGGLFVGEQLPQAGLPAHTPMQIAVSLAGEDKTNPHGVAGYAPIVQDPSDNESKIGFGQHGGLGPNEQRPFLIVDGGGFQPGVRTQPTSLVDIAPTVLRHLHMDHDDMDGRALPHRVI
ncbi:MAG: alkaline phosphatase family protein [Alphaproteobacteria bacterium]|nr:alkaline phosphatase family protein [Alphaproteobacteria bacterium]MBV9965100.1 alkaline phosphatase family protein [Alphaproteobacteria bacterium]